MLMVEHELGQPWRRVCDLGDRHGPQGIVLGPEGTMAELRRNEEVVSA